MIRGFRDTDGNRVPLEEINYRRDAHRFNCSPATLAMLMDSIRRREGVDFSASQLGTTPRQHLLMSRDYYPPTAQAMSAYMGTVKHQQVNVQRAGLIVEQRFTSKRDPRISGQIDHASIVEHTDDGALLVDLYDLKNTKWYSVTLMAKDVWKHHPDYAWQLNLCAALMEENGIKCFLCDGTGLCWECDPEDGGHWAGPHSCHACRAGWTEIRVRNLYLECIPADATYKHAAEASRLGLAEYQKALIQVDRKSADETYAVYHEAMRLRDEAIAAGYAPLCHDRWSNSQIDNLRCRHYCQVKDECIALSHANGDSHPIAPLQDALEASLKAVNS